MALFALQRRQNPIQKIAGGRFNQNGALKGAPVYFTVLSRRTWMSLLMK